MPRPTIDVNGAEYQETLRGREMYRRYGMHYKDILWAEETIERLEKKKPYGGYTDKDRAGFLKVKEIYARTFLDSKSDVEEDAESHTTTHYIWRTMGDGRVRPEHEANDGEIFAWDKPPPTGNPGDAPGCRCWAEPYGSANDTDENGLFNISNYGLEMIAELEGFRSRMYLDTGGNPTIGYGHLLLSGESFPNGITGAEARRLLEKDLRNAENAVNRNVTVDLTQPQFDALVSLTYNIGAGNLKISDVLQHVNGEDFGAAADAFSHFSRSGSNPLALSRRRGIEAALFRAGSP